MTSRTAARSLPVFPLALTHDAPAVAVRPRLRPWLLFTVVVIGAFFALIYSRIALDRTAFDLQKLTTAIEVEETHHWQLRSDVARMQAPERITTLAEEMGLVYPSERIPIAVEGTGVDTSDGGDLRWANLKALLSSQP